MLIGNLFTIHNMFICMCCMQISMTLDGAHLSPTVTQVPLLPTCYMKFPKLKWRLYLDKLCIRERGILVSKPHFMAIPLTHLTPPIF